MQTQTKTDEEDESGTQVEAVIAVIATMSDKNDGRNLTVSRHSQHLNVEISFMVPCGSDGR